MGAPKGVPHHYSNKPKPIMPLGTNVNSHVLMERLTGTKEICSYLGWSYGKWAKWRREMRRDGIIFTELSGVPPKPHIFTFTSLLHRWLVLKNLSGATF